MSASSQKNSSAKQIALFGYYGCGNFGDEAILSAFLANFSHRDNLIVFSSDPEHTSLEHNVYSLRSLITSSIKLFLIRTLGRKRKEFFFLLNMYLKTKIVLFGGGGLFFDTTKSNHYLLSSLRKISQAALIRKKIIIFGIDLGPLHHSSSINMAKKAFQKIESVNFRNQGSQDLFKKLLPNFQNSNVTSDLVFASDIDKFKGSAANIWQQEIEQEFKKNSLVILCLRDEEMCRPNYKKAIVELLKEISESEGLNLVILPLQSHELHDDSEVNNILLSSVKNNSRIHSMKGGYSVAEYFDIISKADFVISERLHGSIAALTLGIPVLGISYKDKVTRLFDSINKPEWQVHLDDLDEDTLKNMFNDLWAKKEESQKEIAAFLPGLKSQALKTIDDLNKQIERILA